MKEEARCNCQPHDTLTRHARPSFLVAGSLAPLWHLINDHAALPDGLVPTPCQFAPLPAQAVPRSCIPPSKDYAQTILRRLLPLVGLGLALLATVVILWTRSRPAVSPRIAASAPPPPALLVSSPPTPPAQPPVPEQPYPHVVTRAGNVIVVAPDSIRPDGTYDVIIHFHGIHPALEPALRESRLNAVLLILELGIGPEIYGQRFFFPEATEQLLKGLRRHVREAYGVSDPKESRLAISAWSAGCGAVGQILRQPRILDRVDAFLLSDALHAAFIDPKHRIPSPERLAPYLWLAQEAIAGRRLFGITHSAIQTGDYASTTETADWLRHQLGLKSESLVSGDGPVTRSQKGSLFILGYPGDDRRAHARQQWMLGRTLWVELAKRWDGRVPPKP